MKVQCTPDQLQDWLASLGAAESILKDLADKPDTNGLFRLMINNWARSQEEIRLELIRAHNEVVNAQ